MVGGSAGHESSQGMDECHGSDPLCKAVRILGHGWHSFPLKNPIFKCRNFFLFLFFFKATTFSKMVDLATPSASTVKPER